MSVPHILGTLFFRYQIELQAHLHDETKKFPLTIHLNLDYVNLGISCLKGSTMTLILNLILSFFPPTPE